MKPIPEWIPFSRLGEVIAGQHIPSEDYDSDDSGTPYLTGPADFTERVPKVTKWTKCPRVLAQQGDVLLTVKGAGCGKSNLGIDAAIGRQLMALRPNSDHLNQAYLFAYIRSQEANINHLGQGATVPGISKGEIEALKIPYFPLPEQQRIAAILDKAQDICRKRECQRAQIDDLINSTFTNIVGPRATGYNRWEERTIGEVADARQGSMRTGPFGSDLKHSEFVLEGIAVLGIDNAVKNRFEWSERRFITPEKYERLQRYRVNPGDVIVTIMGTTGRSAVVPEDVPVAITTKHLATITLNRELADPEFVSNAIHRHPESLRQIGAANRGAIMDGLNLGLIKSLKLRIPPIETQKRFAEVVRNIRKLDSDYDRAQKKADDLFNSLVARAFRGQL